MVRPNLNIVASNSNNYVSNSNVLSELEMKQEEMPPEIPMITVGHDPNETQYKSRSESDNEQPNHCQEQNSSEMDVDSEVMRISNDKKLTTGHEDELQLVGNIDIEVNNGNNHGHEFGKFDSVKSSEYMYIVEGANEVETKMNDDTSSGNVESGKGLSSKGGYVDAGRERILSNIEYIFEGNEDNKDNKAQTANMTVFAKETSNAHESNV